jgi:hypothetical protein
MGSNSVNNMALSSLRLCPKMKQLPPIWPIIDALPRICKSLCFFGSIPTYHLDAHILQENRKNLKKCDIRGIVHPPPSSAAAAAAVQAEPRCCPPRLLVAHASGSSEVRGRWMPGQLSPSAATTAASTQAFALEEITALG